MRKQTQDSESQASNPSNLQTMTSFKMHFRLNVWTINYKSMNLDNDGRCNEVGLGEIHPIRVVQSIEMYKFINVDPNKTWNPQLQTRANPNWSHQLPGGLPGDPVIMLCRKLTKSIILKKVYTTTRAGKKHILATCCCHPLPPTKALKFVTLPEISSQKESILFFLTIVYDHSHCTDDSITNPFNKVTTILKYSTPNIQNWMPYFCKLKP